MPRIEIKPPDQKPDEATPTIDVCRNCSPRFEVGQPVPPYRRSTRWMRTVVLTVDVEHPPYGDKGANKDKHPADLYACDFCGLTLDNGDN